MYTAHITVTTNGYERGAQWQNHGCCCTLTSDTLSELKKKLEERYRYVSDSKSVWKNKRPIYRDTKSGTVQSGWIVGFRAEDQDRSAPDGTYRHLEQDWISITEDHSKELTWNPGKRGLL